MAGYLHDESNTQHSVSPLWAVSLLLALPVLLASGCGREETPSGAAAPKGEAAPRRDVAAKADSKPRSELLAVGAEAPQFEAVAHTGETIKLAQLRGKVVVLYFYPKDNTPGCTIEAQQFAEKHQSLDEAGAVIIGVSSDDNESHRGFAEQHSLPFVLLPDTERSIAEAYGVGSFLGMTSRVTYVVGRDGKIAKVYPDVNPKGHAEQILRDIQRL